jgi:DNA-directed RNA polymerase specialized sigma54-like protein
MDETMAEAEASKPKKKASVKKSKTGSKKETKEKKADAKAARVHGARWLNRSFRSRQDTVLEVTD